MTRVRNKKKDYNRRKESVTLFRATPNCLAMAGRKRNNQERGGKMCKAAIDDLEYLVIVFVELQQERRNLKNIAETLV